MKRFLLYLLIVTSLTYCQNLHIRFDGIPVTIGSSTCITPFNGGIDIPKFQFTDIDNDSKTDLFIYDRDTNLNFYKNIGSISSPQFLLFTRKYQNLSIKNWFYFVDIDNNGVKDLFTGGDSQYVRYYRNFGTPSSPNFILQTYSVKTDLNVPLISESPCFPVFVDIDADGDYDFLTGTQVGRITYYENIGTPSNFQFRFITDYFKNIEIIGPAGTDHGASAITFEDINGNNTKDLFWGDLFGRSIYFIRNTGTPQNFAWTSIDSSYPPPVVWTSAGFNMPGVIDIDSDGLKDFFVGVLIGSRTLNNFVYFKNIGPVNNPQFTKITENFILSIDVGGFSFPCFTDIDNDGDRDLFIGHERSVAYYRNTGSSTSPSFILVTDSLPMPVSNFNFSVSSGDLDGDGKKDLVIGYFALARLRWLKNTGTLSNPVFTYQPSQLDTMNLLQSSAPCLADLDSDGDIDLLAGNSSGRLTYYRNNGSITSFNFTFITNNYQNIFVGNDATPNLSDIDADGDLDLLIGNRIGNIHFYRNTGTPFSPNFILVTNAYTGINFGQNVVPASVDINSDTDMDLFIGNIKGGLYYMENRDVFGLKLIGTAQPKQFTLYANYPDPFNTTTKIKFNLPEKSHTVLKIYDISGKEIKVLLNTPLMPGMYEIVWDAAGLASGIYFCRITSGSFLQSEKMVLIK